MPAAGARAPRREVDGVLLLDKPTGLSSNAALQRARRLFCAAKAGHTGTLDPLASGLLPICFGEATKFAQVLIDADKQYEAIVHLGRATSTGDAEGEVIAESQAPVAREDFEAALPRFLGTVRQIPPRYAALKFEGRAYYEYARDGREIPRPPREITIDAIEVLEWAPPLVALRVACGKGTYVRTLAEDLGAAVGSCAHLAALRRTASGPFAIAGAVTLGSLEAMSVPERDALLLPVDAALAGIPAKIVDAGTARALREGKRVDAGSQAPGRYRGFTVDGRFLGLLEVDCQVIRSVRLLRSPPTQVA
jgi:tRNA pseudouridine55 synthase